MGKTLTHEEFLKKFYEKNPYAENIEILEKYVKNNVPILCRCKIDGHEWNPRPHNLLGSKNTKPTGCPVCRLKGRTRTTEQFVNELKEINPNIEVLGKYLSNEKPIHCRCKICKYEWSPRPSSLLREIGCPKCYGKIKRTTEQFINELKEINPNIEVLGEYLNSHKPIHCRCKICGYDNWFPHPSSLIHRGDNCPKCSGKIKTHEEFINEMKEINDSIEILGRYISAHMKILCRCKIDGYEWKAKPNNLLNKCGCPMCKASKGETRISKYLNNNIIKYEPQKTFDGLYGVGGKLLSYDFYLSQYNLLIEYQGEFHEKGIVRNQTEEQFAKQQEHDRRKREYAEKNGIQLLEIWYWDFDNIEKILEEHLKNFI